MAVRLDLYFAVLLVACICLLSNPGCSCLRETNPEAKQRRTDDSRPTSESRQDNDKRADVERIATESSETSERAAANSTEEASGSDLRRDGDEQGENKSSPTASGAGGTADADDGTEGFVFKPSTDARPKGTGDPRDASRRARKLLVNSKKLAADGKYGEAYQQALAAWIKVKPYAKHDAECRQLETAFLARLKKYGEAANRKADISGGSRSSAKPLAVQ